MADIIEFKPKAKEEPAPLVFTCHCGGTLYEFINDVAVCYRCNNIVDKWPTIDDY